MITNLDLTPFSRSCLGMLLERFPEFKPYVVASHYAEKAWYAEIPWPNEPNMAGLGAGTHGYNDLNGYGEEFRVDIANWHTHSGDYENSGHFEFLSRPFELISKVMREQIAVLGLCNGRYAISNIGDIDYVPKESDWKRPDTTYIRGITWYGTHNHTWNRPELLGGLNENHGC